MKEPILTKKGKHSKKCPCNLCIMCREQKAPAVTGQKTGGKW